MWGGQGWLYYGFAEFNGYNLVPVQFFNQYNLFPDSHVTFVSRLVLELRALGLFDQRKVTRRAWEQKLYFNWERFRLYETASKWFGLPKLSFVVKCSCFCIWLLFQVYFCLPYCHFKNICIWMPCPQTIITGTLPVTKNSVHSIYQQVLAAVS